MEEAPIFDQREDEIVQTATQSLMRVIHADFDILPDFPHFQNPEVYDVSENYEDPVLAMIINHVRISLVQIVGDLFLHSENHTALSSGVLKRICWRIFEAVKLAPLFYKNEGLLVEENDDQLLTPSCDSLTHPDQKKIGDEYRELRESMNIFHVRRYELLEEFLDQDTSDKKERIASYLQNCLHDMSLKRQEIIDFCRRNNHPNPFIAVQSEDVSSFESAVHWNELHHQENALENFSPSQAEKNLYVFLPKDFHEYEWSLFCFAFTSEDDIERAKVSSEFIFQEHMKALRDRQCERKMMIAFYAHFHLLLHRRGKVDLSPSRVQSTKNNLVALELEIEDLRSQIMNSRLEGKEYGKEVSHDSDISPLDDLLTTTQNLVHEMDIAKIDIQVLEITKQLTQLLHSFVAGAVDIRIDDDLEPFEKERIIRDMRKDLREGLFLLQNELQKIEVDLPLVDKTDSIIARALSRLST